MKKIIFRNIIFILLIVITFTNQLNNENTLVLANNNLNNRISQTSTSLSENYDDFRVDTTISNMNRWIESGLGMETSHNALDSKLTFNGDYNNVINFTDMIVFNDQFNNDNLTENIWIQYKDVQDDSERPSVVGGTCFTEDNGFLDLGLTDSVTDQASFYINFIDEDLDDNITLPIRFDTELNLDLVEDDNTGDVAFSLKIGNNETAYDSYFWIKAERYDYGAEERWYFALGYDYNANTVWNYFSGNFAQASDNSGTIFTSSPILNTSVRLIVTEDYTMWYLEDILVSNTTTNAIFKASGNMFDSIGINKEIFGDYEDNGYILIDYVTMFNLEGDLVSETRYTNIEREIENIGRITSQLKFTDYSFINSSIYFENGIKINNEKKIYFQMRNNSLFIIVDDFSYNTSIFITNNQFLEFIINYLSTSIVFEVYSDNNTFFKYEIAHSLKLNKLEVYYSVYQNLSYDLIAIDLYNVKALFKEANAIRTLESGSNSVIASETQQKINFESNYASTTEVTYVYNIQDFSSISGLLKAKTNRQVGLTTININISPINATGLVDLNTDFPSRTKDYMVSVIFNIWWTTTTTGLTLCSFRDSSFTELASSQVNNAVANEVGFYVWQKNGSNTQVGLKYIEPLESDFSEGLDTAIISSSSVFENYNWMEVEISYTYANTGDTATESSIGFSAIRHEIGSSLESPSLMSPSTPTIYSKPTGLIASIVGFFLTPFIWLLGVMIWVVKAILELPELIIKELLDLIAYLVNVVLPIILTLYTEIVEWLFETIPEVEELWEFLVDLLELLIDTVVTIFPIIPLTFNFLIWLITWIIENIYPYVEYWMNKLIEDTNTAIMELFLIMNGIALIPFFIAIMLKSEELNQETIDIEDLFMDNLGYYITFWSFIYNSIISVLKTVLRLIEMVIGFIGGIIP